MIKVEEITKERFPQASESELQAARHIVRVHNSEVAHFCRNGHSDCATVDDGRCAGEAWATLGQTGDPELLEEFELV